MLYWFLYLCLFIC